MNHIKIIDYISVPCYTWITLGAKPLDPPQKCGGYLNGREGASSHASNSNPGSQTGRRWKHRTGFPSEVRHLWKHCRRRYRNRESGLRGAQPGQAVHALAEWVAGKRDLFSVGAFRDAALPADPRPR